MLKIRQSIGVIKSLRSTGESFANGVKLRFERFEKRVEGTFAEKWLKFWMNVGRDYRDVSRDLIKEAREKPSKAILVVTTGWLATQFAVTNPSATHFRDAFLHATNNAAVVHHTLVREDVLDHLKLIESSYNNGLIRHSSFGLFSIIWIDKNSKQISTFEKQCDYLQLSYIDMWNRIVDIGFLDTWWGLVKKMKDYDINY